MFLRSAVLLQKRSSSPADRGAFTEGACRQSVAIQHLRTLHNLIRLRAHTREKNIGIPISPQADNATARRGRCHKSLHRLPRRGFRPPHEPQELRQVAQQFRTVVRQVRSGSTAVQHCSKEHAPESKRCRAINPNQHVSPGQPVVPCGRMPTFEDPALTGLDLMTKTRLLVPTPLDPPWLPVNRVDMHDRQACAFAELARQGTFPRPWLTNDHHPLH